MGSDWIDVSLADVSDRIGDGLHGTPTYCEHGAYPFINGNNLENGSIVVKDATKRVSQDEYLKHKKELTNNTVLVSINGTIGNIALYGGEEVVLGKSACYINLKDGISKHFIKYVMSGYLFQEYIQRCSTGSTIKNVSLKMMRDFRFKIPKTEAEQLEVIQSVKYLDNKITLNRQINQTLEQMAQALFKSWFVDFDPVVDNALDAGFFDQNSDLPEELLRSAEQRKIVREQPNFKPLPAETRQLFPAAFEECEEPSLGLGGWVPKGWRVSKVSDACEKIFSGGTPETRKPEFWDGALCWLSSGETRNRLVVATEKRITELGVEYSSTKKSIKGDILIASAGQGYTRGQTSLNLIDTYINQSIVCLRPLNQTISSWLFENIYSRYEEMRALSDSHSIRGSLTTKLVANMPIILPCEGVLALYSVQHKEQICVANACLNNIEVLSNLRDTLLPKLISGELRLSDDSTLASGNTDC